MNVEINKSRLDYLLSLYKLGEGDFLDLISKGLKKRLSRDVIFTDNIKINHLKRIDKIFNKGLSFYTDPKAPIKTDNVSIFFRKSDFGIDLNLKSKKIVTEFEELKLQLSSLCKIADIDNSRVLREYSLSDDPAIVAKEVRDLVGHKFISNQKGYLKHLINKLGELNILVFEFVETWNQKEKANIDGVFLAPNVIVLKRLDGLSYKREIFTLAHELGHYLLNIEEVEVIDFNLWSNENISNVERWCNSFAFNFLLGAYGKFLNNITHSDASNDYNHEIVDYISDNTNLSKLAIYTQLLIDRKISQNNYLRVKNELNKQALDYRNELRSKREKEKAEGKEVRGSAPTPIRSELLIDLVRSAFYEGVIDEYQACNTLKIKPNKLENYIAI